MNNVARDGWNGEIPNNCNQKENQVGRVCFSKKGVRVAACRLELHHIKLNLRGDRTEYIGHRQPHKYIDVTGKPLPEGMLKSVKYTEPKSDGSKDRQHNQFERPDGVNAKGCAFVEEFKDFCNPGFYQVLDAEKRKGV